MPNINNPLDPIIVINMMGGRSGRSESSLRLPMNLAKQIAAAKAKATSGDSKDPAKLLEKTNRTLTSIKNILGKQTPFQATKDRKNEQGQDLDELQKKISQSQLDNLIDIKENIIGIKNTLDTAVTAAIKLLSGSIDNHNFPALLLEFLLP